MTEPSKSVAGDTRVFSVKLPKNHGAQTLHLIISVYEKGTLTIQNPEENAELLCNYLMVLVDSSVLIELANKLQRRFHMT